MALCITFEEDGFRRRLLASAAKFLLLPQRIYRSAGFDIDYRLAPPRFAVLSLKKAALPLH